MRSSSAIITSPVKNLFSSAGTEKYFPSLFISPETTSSFSASRRAALSSFCRLRFPARWLNL
ncbi:MAG: hypothetical protein L0Y76_07280 [Ignavibacteria bacterium]|nr:hypothetical protein [Ignavibacteria bacterium]